MPSISSIRQPVYVEAPIELREGLTITVTFDRNKITDAWVKEQRRLEEESDTRLSGALADLIETWDVVNEDGTAYPATAETIGELFSFPDKEFMFDEIMRAAKPSRAEGNASPERSSTPPLDSTPLLPTSPNGPVPSLSPQPSTAPSTT